MRVLGMQSGTSHDGIDAAVVEFTAHGPALAAELVWGVSAAYSAVLREDLVRALPPAAVTLEEVCRLDTHIGQEFAALAARAVEAVGGIDLVCSHGQTVFHGVGDGRVWGTLQLGQPAWIAEATGAWVVADVRARDVAAGGQGAPLVPLLDEMIASSLDGATGLLNLGGIANVTVVAPDRPVMAFDIGPANALVDAAMTTHPNAPASFDADGAAAARGKVDPDALANLLAEPYLGRPAPKTTGKELFNEEYVRRIVPELDGDDLVATLTESSARAVADAINGLGVERVIASGGGVRNPTLLNRIREMIPVPVLIAEEIGVPSDLKEAIAFALIGWLTAHGMPGHCRR